MKIVLHGDGRTEVGGAPMICHNERLADPLDPFVIAISAFSRKTRKTEQDHREIAYLEFLGSLYTDPVLSYPLDDDALDDTRIVVPAWNVIRCLQDGAKRHKQGKNVLRGVTPLSQVAAIEFDGPTNPVDLFRTEGFALRKTVGVQAKRTVRTRPIFSDWQIRLEVEVDDTVFDLHTVETLWKDAGWYSGLGDMRPVYGRFVGKVEVV